MYAVAHIRRVMEKSHPSYVGKAIESMIKNGRLNTTSSLDLQQVSTYLYDDFELFHYIHTLCA